MSKNIRPITELRKTNEISDLCHNIKEPIYITKNGYSDLVIMSQELFDNKYDFYRESKQTEPSVITFQDNTKSINYGFVRVRTISQEIEVADVDFNLKQIIQEIDKAVFEEVDVIAFPELSITGYSCGDLFLQKSLLDKAKEAIDTIVEHSSNHNILIACGAPYLLDQKIFNCAFLISNGRLLSIVPKTHLPNYNEFYEKRYFSTCPKENYRVIYKGYEVPFGNKTIIESETYPNLKIGVEICEDLWAPCPPSTMHVLNGATLILNLSASNETLSKSDYRHDLISVHSKQSSCAYAYASSRNESSTDLVYIGSSSIMELGDVLDESQLYIGKSATADVDIERIVHYRMQNTSYETRNDNYEYVKFKSSSSEKAYLNRHYVMTPFVPLDLSDKKKWCQRAISLQVHGLAKRMSSTKITNLVLGLSGGLDSTLALLVAIEVKKTLGQSVKEIYAYSMPCYGTGGRTKSNARKLAELTGVSFEEVDISKSVDSHLSDLKETSKTSVTFENAQARERTQFLFDKANQLNALVIGTGDLSELALGYCTYNGDHMSSYSVNCSIPKTLIREIVKYYGLEYPRLNEVLSDIIETPISPELLPIVDTNQFTEEIVGPYILHDFFLYHMLVDGYDIEKIGVIAIDTFKEKYIPETIIKWLEVFVRRFYSSQFKRSVLPDGVKVTDVSLSPRGDYRMPSDASNALALEKISNLKKKYL